MSYGGNWEEKERRTKKLTNKGSNYKTGILIIKPLVLLKLLFLLLLFIFPPINKINKQSTGLEKTKQSEQEALYLIVNFCTVIL